ncbi:MAG TPA: hypothetical protein VIA62_25515, partial [Thermoanaerobaculia bacterium]|nr:hypothetical protein [Thermoanaerobaculia bacterium]
MTQTTLAAVIIGGTLVAWALFILYLRARPEAAPHVESSLMSPQSSTGAVPGTVIERSPRARRSGDDAAGVTRRQFINRAYFAAIAVGLLNFALASLDYLWPRGGGGLGSK